jgi:hypothetical protein
MKAALLPSLALLLLGVASGSSSTSGVGGSSGGSGSGSGSGGSSIPFSSFAQTCERRLDAPLERFYGSRPHPDLSMVADSVLWPASDPNLAILPKWTAPKRGANLTAPFVDTHVAVRFLGGVGNLSDVTHPNCKDGLHGSQPSSGVDRKGIWCDLVVRQPDGSLKTRFDLVHSRLDRFVDNGVDLMIVLDDVPWAFVNVSSETCQGFGCQYLPPNDPREFAAWVGSLAAYMLKAWGQEYASRIRWRLGTEANGPRWSNHGEVFAPYLNTYRLTMQKIKEILPAAQVGASNWVEVVGNSGNLSLGGTDSFQYRFYTALAADAAIPLDWVSVSHYGGGPKRPNGFGNFPGCDYIQRTPAGTAGEFELAAMRSLAERPGADMEVMEWSILKNEAQQATWEPSSVGTAWSAGSVTSWMCHGVTRIFHWETGTTLRNSSGDGRLVNFYEQWPWNMALLELFLGGEARFATWHLPPAPDTSPGHREPPPLANGTGWPMVSLIESVHEDEYFALVAGVGHNRTTPFSTQFELSTDAPLLLQHADELTWEQYKMNASYSVIETIVAELQGKPGTLLHNDGLPYDTGRLLTAAGREYAEAPENLERYWKMHSETFQPKPFEGTWSHDEEKGATKLSLEVEAYSVTVVSARRAR